MPYIRTLNNFLLSYHPPRDIWVRRKSHLTRAQARQLIVGCQCRLAMYVATSKKAWDEFPAGVGGQDVRMEFHIPAGCFQACDIEQISIFGREQEILLVPYSPITITGNQKDPTTGIITIQASVAQDGRNVNLDMRSQLA
eukprot:TRINITY_DN74363_c0_g1_i1.p1 TRINITY_DN74363_c0_g1~~TRINITY_DN74363_c0_g1_i1.p1  ORF type:complete len:140 (-),score=5.99 TRINITY_DN74363_c0_g1_i1:36-455(-)